MKLDQWTLFNLPADARQMVNAFASPDNETSIVKDIPIGALDQARPVIKLIEHLTNRKARIIYRGPRRDLCRSWCRRDDARRFAVYFR